MTMQILQLIIGAALLFLGRQLYWLFVAGVGFLVALDLLPRLVEVESTILILIIALVVGLIGAVLAVVLQKVMIGVAGFLASAYLVVILLEGAGLEIPILVWVLAIVAGIIGAVLTVALFGWALILLSSLTGAWMIADGLNLSNMFTWLAFLILMAVGVGVQAAVRSRQEVEIEEDVHD